PFDGTMDLNGDGNLQDNNGILPLQAIAERYDIIINFAKNGIKAGDKLYFVNLQEHRTGKGPEAAISLADVLSGKYKAVIKQTSKGPQWDNGDPAVGKFLQLLVQPYTGQDLSMDPVAYEPAKPGKAAGLKMLPLPIDRNSAADLAKLKDARHREFIFGRSDGTDTKPWTIKTDGGFGYSMDPRRISAAPQLANQSTDGGFSGDGTLEVWKIVNGGNGWSHPVHVHFEEGVILSRDGKAPPEWEKWARKDVYRIGPDADSSEEVEMAIRFREFAGTYMEHCHNTQHEDSSMLLRWDIEHPGQFQVMPTPLPGWDGVQYMASVGLPTFRTKGHDDNDDPANKPPVAANDSAATTAGKAITLNVLANDTDPDGNVPLTVTGLSQPDSGLGSVSTDGTTVTYTPPATVATPFTASFNYTARDAKGAESVTPATVSIAVSAAAAVDQIQVTSATVQVRSGNRFTWDVQGTTTVATGNSISVTAATTGGPVSLGNATLTAATTGARWRVSVTTTGFGPATPATVTVKSTLGQTVTAPVRYQ
ncbi:MAG: Ig-like domain-containing protein, partial [Pseudomonas putida]